MTGHAEKGIMRVEFSNIPYDLQSHKQWVAWKAVPNGNGKFTKIPVDPNTGKMLPPKIPVHGEPTKKRRSIMSIIKGSALMELDLCLPETTHFVVSTWITVGIRILDNLNIGLREF